MTDKEFIKLGNALEPYIRELDKIVRGYKLDDDITVALGSNSLSWIDYRDENEDGYKYFRYSIYTNGTSDATRGTDSAHGLYEFYRKG